MRIYLIGFMGSGKSHLGELLANNLNFKFVDSDQLIESAEQKSIEEIINLKGENYFRDLEKSLLRKRLARMQNTIIATGGGMPCFNSNLELMFKSGLVIYLKSDVDTLVSRLKDDTTRPLLKHENLKQFVEDLLERRKEFYEQGVVVEKANLSKLKKLIHLK